MQYIDEQFIENLIHQSSIVDYISQYLDVDKNKKCNCPFHAENKPSFSIKTKDGNEFFHCFGCGVGGNIVNFIMKYHNLSYQESIQHLADYMNVEVQFKDKSNIKGVNLYNEIKSISKLFQSQINNSAINYLCNERGLSKESIDKFQIGFCYSNIKGFDNNILSDLGIVNENGTNLLANKITFPILHSSNQVIGFTSKSINNVEDAPKYVHCRNSDIYTRNKSLFGLQTLKSRIVDYIFVTEGVFDVIIPHQNGVNNIVACLGNSLSKEQIAILYKRTSHIILCFDGDKGGYDGMYKAMLNILPFLEGERRLSFIRFPEGFDPAEKPELLKIENAIPSSIYLFEEIEKRENINLESVEGKQRFINSTTRLIHKIKSITLQLLFKKNLELIVGVPVNFIIDGNKMNIQEQNAKRNFSLEDQAIICLLQEPSNAQLINIDKNSPLYLLTEDIIENGFVSKDEILDFYKSNDLNHRIIELCDFEKAIDNVWLVYKRLVDRISKQYERRQLFEELD